MSVDFLSVTPILRMFDVAVTKRFYVDYLGCAIEAQSGEGDRPIDILFARGPLRLQLSSHHGDGAPGAVVLVFTTGVDELHAELASRQYPFLNPAVEPGPAGGRELTLIDPASNQIRFYERALRPGADH